MASRYPRYCLEQVEQVQQVGGGSGRWEGPGVVYVMTYTHIVDPTKYYKIGCTSRDPEIRQKEVERKEREHRKENSIVIQLLGFVHADKMRDAETIAQRDATTKLGLQKDVPSRGNATDWFIDTNNLKGQQVLDAVANACGGSVTVYHFNNDINCYSKKEATIVPDPLPRLMSITTNAVKEANKRCQSGYVFVTKTEAVRPNRYSYNIDCTESDPVKRVQEIQNHAQVKTELIGFVYAKQMERAKKKAEKAVIDSKEFCWA